MRKLFVLAVVLLFAGSAQAYVGKEYVVNGDFETGDLSSWGWDINLNAGVTTDTAPHGSGQGGVGGDYAADFDWAAGQYLRQQIWLKDDHSAITADLELELTFWFSGHSNVMIRDARDPREGPYIERSDIWWAYYADGVFPNPDADEWTYADRSSNNMFVSPYVFGPSPWIITIPAGTSEIVIQFGGGYSSGTRQKLDNVSLVLVPLAGDVNDDGFVGGVDVNRIITNWGMTGASREDGDLDGDGTVSAPDYTEIMTNWGAGTLPLEPPGATPEPSTLLLLAGGLLAGLIRRRQTDQEPLRLRSEK